MSGPRTTRLTLSAVGVLLAAALLVGFNYLSARHWSRGDWTKARIYSISETTKKTLDGLKKPVRVTVFMSPQRSRLYTPVRELLTRYRDLSRQVEVEYVDPQRNPARAEQLVREFGIRQNTVVFRSGDRKKYVEEDKLADLDFAGMGTGRAPSVKGFKGEEAFTSAILSVTEERTPKVYFTKGHGEASLESAERGRGFSEAKELLERDNMTVSSFDSLGKDQIPADADVVIVAGPRAPFLAPEAGALARHQQAGGRLLLLLDPVVPGPGAPPADFGLGELIAAYGVRLGNDIVIDPSNALPMVGAEVVLANRFGSSPIVRSLSAAALPVIFELARSVTKAEKPPNGVAEAMLVETSPEGWGETDLANLDREVQKGPGDTPGPVSLAVSVGPADEKKPEAAKTARVVIVGNSRFAANGALANPGNANLFRNAAHWLAGSERQIGIAPKTPEQASLALSDAQVRRIGWFTALGMPAAAILIGVWVWYRRRD